MFGKIFEFIKNHFDFRFYGVSWITLLVLLSVILMLVLNMPQKFGYENELLENIQMAVLFFIMYLCLTSKVNKNFFNFIALALTIIIIREVNCGRTLFFPIPGEYHKYYSWKALPWPWLGKVAHGLYGLWITIVGLIFFKKAVYKDLWKIVKNVKFPIWQLLFGGLGIFMGAIAEEATNNNFIFEEGFELLFYVALAGVIWLYSRNKNFILEEEENE